MPCAAVFGSKTFCPLVTPGVPPTPHTGGTIISGAPTVLIGGKPAARVGDSVLCNGVPPHPDSIILGSSSVLICDMPAAYIGSNTSTGGIILDGCITVQIGV